MLRIMTHLILGITCIQSVVKNAEAKTQASFAPVLRMSADLYHIRANEQANMLAFTDKDGKNLRILDLKTRNVYPVSKHKVGHSYFWAPNGFRLIYRELVKDETSITGITSLVKVFDSKLRSHVEVGSVAGPSGHLSFDPRDHRFYLYHENGVLSRRILYPDERFSRWQMSQKTRAGRWLLSLTEVLWLSNDGLSLKAIGHDRSGIQSFDLSADASSMVWSTKAGKVYMSRQGQPPRELGEGRSVKWHPSKPLILSSVPRRVGNKIASWDLALTDPSGKRIFLTDTPLSDEDSGEWYADGSNKILFTIARSTDLFLMKLKNQVVE